MAPSRKPVGDDGSAALPLPRHGASIVRASCEHGSGGTAHRPTYWRVRVPWSRGPTVNSTHTARGWAALCLRCAVDVFAPRAPGAPAAWSRTGASGVIVVV